MSTPLEPPPRKVHLKRGVRNLRRAYRTLFALVILVFAGWAALDSFRWYDLTHRVQVTQGKITKKQTIVRPAGSEYHLEYSFTADDTPVVNDTTVTHAVFENHQEGQAVKVVYRAHNARLENWLFDNDAPRLQAMYLTIGHGLAALLAVVVLRLVERPLARELQLARFGTVAPGRIVSIGKPRGRRGIVRFAYAFRTAAGAEIEGACNLPRRFPAHTLEPGMAIEVLHDPKRPRVHKPRLALDFVEFGETPKKARPGS